MRVRKQESQRVGKAFKRIAEYGRTLIHSPISPEAKLRVALTHRNHQDPKDCLEALFRPHLSRGEAHHAAAKRFSPAVFDGFDCSAFWTWRPLSPAQRSPPAALRPGGQSVSTFS